jgi:hypothetical protein
MPKKLIALATAGLALTLLAGCSGGDGGSSGGDSGSSSAPSASKTAAAAPAQTKEEACSLLENELASFLKEQGANTAPSDVKARGALIGEFVQRIDSALTKVSNERVHDTFEEFSGAAKSYSSAIESGSAEDSPEVKKAQSDVQTTLDQVSAVCPAKS